MMDYNNSYELILKAFLIAFNIVRSNLPMKIHLAEVEKKLTSTYINSNGHNKVDFGLCWNNKV